MQKVRALLGNDFVRNNLVYFIGSMAVSFLNYLYYPVLGHVLSVEQFGEIQVLISLYIQMTIFLSVLGLVSTNVVLNVRDSKVVNHTVSELEKVSLYASVIILLAVAVLSPFLKSALKFDSIWPFIIITLVFVAGVPLGFRSAFLRGKGDFVGTSIQGIIASFLKIVASVVLVLVGLKVTGAAGGILVAQLLAFAYAAYKAKKLGFERHRGGAGVDWHVLRPQFKFAGLVLFVSLVTTLLYSADVTVIKYLFSPQVAGEYAGMSTIARIILFLTGSIAIVLLSSVKLDRPPEQNSRLLIRSLGLTLAIGGSTTLVFALFPTQIIHLLFGRRYDNFAHLLPMLSLAMLAISLSTLMSNYHIALRHYWVAFYVGLGAVVTAGLIAAFHASPDAIVGDLAAGAGTLFMVLLCWTGYRAGFTIQGWRETSSQ